MPIVSQAALGILADCGWTLRLLDEGTTFASDPVLVEPPLDVFLSDSGRAIECVLRAPLSDETLEHLLLDLVLPKLIAARGHLVLHAAVIDYDGEAVAFLAASGHGKSTLSASLHAKGFPLINDDAMILLPEGTGLRADRLYPTLRLFPDSLDHLFPASIGTAPVADYTTKRRVNFVTGVGGGPLRALFRLTDPGANIRVTRLSPARACMAIIANAFALDPSDTKETLRRFAHASQAAQTVPVYDLTYPRDYAALPDVHTAIFETLETGQAPE